MAFNLTQTLINSHLVSGNMQPGNEIALRIDQALLQDVLGTLVMLELEAMGVDAHHSLRISVGWSTADDDVDALLHALPDVLTRLRALAH